MELLIRRKSIVDIFLKHTTIVRMRVFRCIVVIISITIIKSTKLSRIIHCKRSLKFATTQDKTANQSYTYHPEDGIKEHNNMHDPTMDNTPRGGSGIEIV